MAMATTFAPMVSGQSSWPDTIVLASDMPSDLVALTPAGLRERSSETRLGRSINRILWFRRISSYSLRTLRRGFMIIVGIVTVIVVTFGPGVPVHWSAHVIAYVAARADGSPYVQPFYPKSAIMGWTNGVTATEAHGENHRNGSQGITLASLATTRSLIFLFWCIRGHDCNSNRPCAPRARG